MDRPPLDDAYALPPSAREELRRKGHTVVRDLASREEVAAYRPAVLETDPRTRYDHRPLAERDTCGRAFVQMLNLWPHDERVRAFVFARRFDRDAWLRGCEPGEPAAGERDPVLYRRGGAPA